MQHGLHDIGSVMRGIGAIALAGKPALVRIPVGDNATASRVLDMGAEAVIAPMINTVAEARALVAAMKYPPIGERSWGPNRVLAMRGTEPQVYLESGNRASLAFGMIETRRALAALDDILGVDGLDGVFVGPSDLSVTLSDGARIAPFDPIARCADPADRRSRPRRGQDSRHLRRQPGTGAPFPELRLPPDRARLGPNVSRQRRQGDAGGDEVARQTRR